jgi:hypothetical protein
MSYIDTFDWLCKELSSQMKEHPFHNHPEIQEAGNTVYGTIRLMLIKLVKESHQASVIEYDKLSNEDWK